MDVKHKNKGHEDLTSACDLVCLLWRLWAVMVLVSLKHSSWLELCIYVVHVFIGHILKSLQAPGEALAWSRIFLIVYPNIAFFIAVLCSGSDSFVPNKSPISSTTFARNLFYLFIFSHGY